MSDDSPFDRFADGHHDALTNQEIAGLLDVETRAFCRFCHSGAEFTRASLTSVTNNGAVDSVLSSPNGSVQILFTDMGFSIC